MSEEIALRMVYLAYILRALALLLGASFVYLGARTLEKYQPNTSEIHGTWGGIALTLRNAPAGAITILLGTVVMVATLVKGEPSFRSEQPGGPFISMDTSPPAPAPAADPGPPTRLTLEDQEQIAQIATTEGALTPGELHVGEIVEGSSRLTTGRRISVWDLQATQGQSLTVDLSSNDFDTMLFIVGPSLDEALIDDDSGEGSNSRLSFTAPADGSYRVIVSSFNAQAVGAYRLSLATRPDRDSR